MSAAGTVLESDEHGPLVVSRRRDPRVLHAGEHVSPDGGRTIWRVERVTQTAAEVRQVIGGAGATTWSRSSVVDRVSEAEVETRRKAQEAARSARAAERDEHRCWNCWTGEPKEVDGVDRGRDPNCRRHEVDQTKLSPLFRPAVKNTPEDTARVLQLRAAGRSLPSIVAEMGEGWTYSRAHKVWKDHERGGKK